MKSDTWEVLWLCGAAFSEACDEVRKNHHTKAEVLRKEVEPASDLAVFLRIPIFVYAQRKCRLCLRALPVISQFCDADEG